MKIKVSTRDFRTDKNTRDLGDSVIFESFDSLYIPLLPKYCFKQFVYISDALFILSILAECEEDVGDGDNNLVTVILYNLINTKTSVSRRKDNKVKVSPFYYDSIFSESFQAAW